MAVIVVKGMLIVKEKVRKMVMVMVMVMAKVMVMVYLAEFVLECNVVGSM